MSIKVAASCKDKTCSLALFQLTMGSDHFSFILDIISSISSLNKSLSSSASPSFLLKTKSVPFASEAKTLNT